MSPCAWRLTASSFASEAFSPLSAPDPSTPARPARHSPWSIASLRRRIARHLIRSLPRCPCCGTDHSSGRQTEFNSPQLECPMTVEFRSLTEGIDTTTPMGKFYFTMSSALAQLERDRLIERTRAGLVAAKARGRTGGRKPKLTAEQIEMARGLLDGGKPPREVAKAFGVGRTT